MWAILADLLPARPCGPGRPWNPGKRRWPGSPRCRIHGRRAGERTGEGPLCGPVRPAIMARPSPSSASSRSKRRSALRGLPDILTIKSVTHRRRLSCLPTSPGLTMHAVMNAVIGAQRLASFRDPVKLKSARKVIDALSRETIRIILLGCAPPNQLMRLKSQSGRNPKRKGPRETDFLSPTRPRRCGDASDISRSRAISKAPVWIGSGLELRSSPGDRAAPRRAALTIRNGAP